MTENREKHIPKHQEEGSRVTLAVESALAGDRACFEELITIYQEKIFRLVYYRTGTRMDAEDLTQDIFMKAFKNIGDFEEKSSFSSWLFSITMNVSLDARKSKVRRRKYLLSKKSVCNVKQETSEPNEKSGIDDNLLEGIYSLSDHQQAALVLRYFHNSSIRELADVLDCTESTVRNHLHRALQKLEKILRKRK